MGQLRHKLVEFGGKLDGILERIIKEGMHVGKCERVCICVGVRCV